MDSGFEGTKGSFQAIFRVNWLGKAPEPPVPTFEFFGYLVDLLTSAVQFVLLGIDLFGFLRKLPYLALESFDLRPHPAIAHRFVLAGIGLDSLFPQVVW